MRHRPTTCVPEQALPALGKSVSRQRSPHSESNIVDSTWRCVMRSINVKALVLSAVLVACLFGALPPAAFAQEDPPPAPTPTPTPACMVDSDKTGYLAGETITISGSGFGPNEAVSVKIARTPEPSDGDPAPWEVWTDPAGAFTATWAIDTLDHSGNTFTVSASSASGSAQASFRRIAVIGTHKYDYEPGETTTAPATCRSRSMRTGRAGSSRHGSWTRTTPKARSSVFRLWGRIPASPPRRRSRIF
ncbi:MAG: hypothetical protein H6Q02_391 [Acidobacteria bacterium]|nr:hypothetical protein [Acidobacteriota bacterium]